tara:strand:+ start:4431 stop:4631 length:201 start_codon:yes stop_codon:yes gene_type:complete
MTSQKIKWLSERYVTDTTKLISNFVKKLGETLMAELYPLFTYTGLGFCVLIGLSWGISLFDKSGEV